MARKTAQRLCDTCGMANEVEVRDLLEGSTCRGCRGRLRPLAKPMRVDAASLEAIVKGTRLPVLVEVQLRGSNEERDQVASLEKVAERMEGKLIVVKLDAHDDRELVLRLGVETVPAFVVFLDGTIAYSYEGHADAALMEEWVWQLTRG
ncbi:MAG: thioredoxin family protein [Deltaproteobacteria bacterium]|nr:thioredoxin family protein [Deltaproteobacteria bacterium]